MEQPVQNPFTFYIRALLGAFIALFMRLLAIAPLACLLAFPAGSPLRWLALLCPALMVALILPLRFSFAQALVQRRGERRFSFDTALNLRDYGEKLTEGVYHALHVAKWGLPLAGMLAYAYYWYKDVDALTLLQTVTSIGRGWSEARCAVGNFFLNLFGSANTLVPPASTLMEGVAVLLGVLGLGVAVWLYGAVRNSAARYVWVIANRGDRSLRKELRRRMRGRRWAQLGVGLVNLLLWAPFALVAAKVAKGVVSDLSAGLMTAVLRQSMPVMDLAAAVLPLLGAFLLLYMPLLPLRRMLTAAFATRERAAIRNEAALTAPDAQQ